MEGGGERVLDSQKTCCSFKTQIPANRLKSDFIIHRLREENTPSLTLTHSLSHTPLQCVRKALIGSIALDHISIGHY